jgi:hypothetical protein
VDSRSDSGFINATCSSPAALENPLNTTARGFREICENFKPYLLEVTKAFTFILRQL